MTSPRLVRLGIITSPHGIRGQVKIRSFTEYPEDLTAYGPLTDEKGKAWGVTVTSTNQDVVIATIAGITTREQAETLRNINLFVPRSALPQAAENEYYHEDLIGLNIRLENGEAFGTLTAIQNFGAGDLAQVKLANGKEELYPFNKMVFPVIDLDKGTAVIALPDYITDHE